MQLHRHVNDPELEQIHGSPVWTQQRLIHASMGLLARKWMWTRAQHRQALNPEPMNEIRKYFALWIMGGLKVRLVRRTIQQVIRHNVRMNMAD